VKDRTVKLLALPGEKTYLKSEAEKGIVKAYKYESGG